MTKDQVPSTLPRAISNAQQKPVNVSSSASVTMPRKVDGARMTLRSNGNGGASASCDQLADPAAVPQVGRKGAKPQKGVAGQAGGRNTHRCLVTYLDGTQQQFFADPEAPGGTLIETVCDCLAITEREYFGMSFRSEKDTVWLDREKKLIKQTKKFMFEFRVKFYPSDPNSLREDLTRYYIGCQVRQDILEGKLPCSFLTYAILGSYIVQADVGDFDPNAHIGIDYIQDQLFAPDLLQTPELLERIAELHRGIKGQTPEEADTHYLENATKLSFYGVHLTPVKDQEGDDVQIGVYYGGVVVYRNFLRIVRFSWAKIIKLSFLRNKFVVRRRPTEGEANEVDETFKLPDYKRAKGLWKVAVDHHAFFRMREPEAPARPRFMPRVGTLNRNTSKRDTARTQYQLANSDTGEMDGNSTTRRSNKPTADGNWGTLPDINRKPNDDLGLANERHAEDLIGAPGRASQLTSTPRYGAAPDEDAEMRQQPHKTLPPSETDAGLFGVPPHLVPAVRDALRQAAVPHEFVAPGGITPAAVTKPLPDALGGRTNFTHGRFAIERAERFATRKTPLRTCLLPREDVNNYLHSQLTSGGAETDLDEDLHDRELELAILSVTGVDPHASVIEHHQQQS